MMYSMQRYYFIRNDSLTTQRQYWGYDDIIKVAVKDTIRQHGTRCQSIIHQRHLFMLLE